MNVFDLETVPVERIDASDTRNLIDQISSASVPTVFYNLGKDIEQIESWSLDHFSQIEAPVPVQEPESDGVNYFVDYFRLPLSEFVNRIQCGEKLYIGARQILGEKGRHTDKDGLGLIASEYKIPSFIDPARIWSCNLWIGAGDNNTLLHYDPWDGVLLLGAGKKDFLLFPPSATPKMRPYGAFDLPALARDKILHSKIRPMDVQKEYQEGFGSAVG